MAKNKKMLLLQGEKWVLYKTYENYFGGDPHYEKSEVIAVFNKEEEAKLFLEAEGIQEKGEYDFDGYEIDIVKVPWFAEQ